MNFYTFISKKEGRLYGGIFALCLIYLVAIQGYATGYEWEKFTLMNWLWQLWSKPGGDWNFGVFVLPVAIVLFWQTRQRYENVQIKPNTVVGLLLIVFSLFCYFVGYKANERYFGFFGIQLLLAGAILWFLGWDFFKKFFWLWLLIGSMWPWEFLIGPISTQLQMVMVRLTGMVLNLIGDPAVVNGTALLSKATESLEAGERWALNIHGACSGMRSLFALGMIGIVFAYLAVKEEWKRWVLVACIPIIAILGNLVRMLMLYVGVLTMGSEWAIGRGEGNESSFHIGSGLIVFVVALACLMTLVTFLNKGMRAFKRRKVVATKV